MPAAITIARARQERGTLVTGGDYNVDFASSGLEDLVMGSGHWRVSRKSCGGDAVEFRIVRDVAVAV